MLIKGKIQRHKNSNDYCLITEDGKLYNTYPGASKARRFWIDSSEVTASLQPFTIITDNGGSPTRRIETFVAIALTAAK